MAVILSDMVLGIKRVATSSLSPKDISSKHFKQTPTNIGLYSRTDPRKDPAPMGHLHEAVFLIPIPGLYTQRHT